MASSIFGPVTPRSAMRRAPSRLRTRPSAFPPERARGLLVLIEADLARGLLAEAHAHLNETVELCTPIGNPFFLSQAVTLQARLARLDGDPGGAQSSADQALATGTAVGANARVADALEVLAGVAADLDSSQEAARLFGAAGRVRDETGYRRCVSERHADLQDLRDTLGSEGFDVAYEEGRSLDLGDAVAYARRGRGERKRPDTGWASLTPAETQVVTLIKDGLANADIARQLMCSPRTIQAHLTHIYAKLGLTSRTQLAAKQQQQ